MKTVRTSLYGDQLFSLWEMEILHTPTLQRLYDLKQLGFADRVFPDAVHSRFNHALGVAHLAEQMTKQLVNWLRSPDAGLALSYADTAFAHEQQISTTDFANLVESRLGVVRLVGILHDLTHAAYGHTLEDEIHVLPEKHDDSRRQVRFFNTLVAQLVIIWSVELGLREPDTALLEDLRRLAPPESILLEYIEEVSDALPPAERHRLARYLRDLELAFHALLHIEYLHSASPVPPDTSGLVIAKIIPVLDPEVGPVDFVVHRDAVLVDIVGNTICADLLDYAHRDSTNAGLRVQFDARLLRYVVAVSVAGPLSPSRQPCIRLAIQFFTNKMRYDVLSEMSGILKARYLISERILFHPTKCAAGAMLGTAVQLLGLQSLPPWMQALGDSDFLTLLTQTAIDLERACERILAGTTAPDDTLDSILQRLWPLDERKRELVSICGKGALGHHNVAVAALKGSLPDLSSRAAAARLVLWRLSARRFPKLVYRLRSEIMHSGGLSADDLSAKYIDRTQCYTLERRVEALCHLPLGSVFVHCPRRNTTMKVAEALVVGSDLTRVAHFRDVTAVCGEGLGPYQEEIKAVEKMYGAIWQLHVYLDSPHLLKQRLVANALEREIGFPNDRLLLSELETSEPTSAYDLLATELRDDVAITLLPEVISKLDETVRFRLEAEPRSVVRHAIQDVVAASLTREVAGEHPGSSRPRRRRSRKPPAISDEGATLLD